MSRTAERVTQADVARCIRAGGAAKREWSMLQGEINNHIANNAEQVLG
jgi:hypothetical protein